MVLNLDRCIGCYNCQIACKDEHVGNDFPGIAKPQPAFGHFWMGIKEVERALSPSHIRVHYVPTLCQHCADAPCMRAAKGGAIYRRDDGIVIIDPVKAVAQKQLVESCPYGAIFWNEQENLPQKCTFCAHLLDDGWSVPRCVQTCPTGCITFGDLQDPKSTAAKLLAEKQGEARHPEFETKPSVYYVGLPKPHLSGRVAFGDTDEWAADVVVTLIAPTGEKRQAKTDGFGDFAFDSLDGRTYAVRFDASGYHSQTHEIALKVDTTYLGEIVLRK
jgi:Fe-S-cluster-containing dehydrogenase component